MPARSAVLDFDAVADATCLASASETTVNALYDGLRGRMADAFTAFEKRPAGACTGADAALFLHAELDGFR